MRADDIYTLFIFVLAIGLVACSVGWGITSDDKELLQQKLDNTISCYEKGGKPPLLKTDDGKIYCNGESKNMILIKE